MILEVLASEIRQRKETKGKQIRKEANLSLFADGMTVNIEHSKKIHKKTTYTIEFSKVTGYKVFLAMKT